MTYMKEKEAYLIYIFLKAENRKEKIFTEIGLRKKALMNLVQISIMHIGTFNIG